MKSWRPRSAFWIWGTTVRSKPSTPGNTSSPAWSRAIKLARTSSLTERGGVAAGAEVAEGVDLGGVGHRGDRSRLVSLHAARRAPFRPLGGLAEPSRRRPAARHEYQVAAGRREAYYVLIITPTPMPRSLLAALAAFVVLVAVPTAGAQGARIDPSLAADHIGGVHVVTAGPDGTLRCDVATEREFARTRAVEDAPVRLTEVPRLLEGAELSPFRIVLRATDQLIERPQALLAFRRAAARWERVIQSPLTVVIDVDYGPVRFGTGEYEPNTIASASSALRFFGNNAGPAEVVARLKNRNTGDAQLQALYDAIPVPTPSTYPDGNGGQNLGTAIGGFIPLQALGALPARISSDPEVVPFGVVPNIGFNSAFNYDFRPERRHRRAADGLRGGRGPRDRPHARVLVGGRVHERVVLLHAVGPLPRPA